MPYSKGLLRIFALIVSAGVGVVMAHDYKRAVAELKPSVVAVGTYAPLRQPAHFYLGTGFVVADGKHAVTNFHVVDKRLNEAKREQFAIFVKLDGSDVRKNARIVGFDREKDLALLAFDGLPLPKLNVNSPGLVAEGSEVLFTGFPLGTALGINPVSHRGMVSAVVNIIEPMLGDGQLTPERIRQLRSPFVIYQLDGTAYPGNSGSPVVDMESGKVIAVINKTFVQKSKEAAVTNPSGISYAIPIQYVKRLLDKHGIRP